MRDRPEAWARPHNTVHVHNERRARLLTILNLSHLLRGMNMLAPWVSFHEVGQELLEVGHFKGDSQHAQPASSTLRVRPTRITVQCGVPVWRMRSNLGVCCLSASASLSLSLSLATICKRCSSQDTVRCTATHCCLCGHALRRAPVTSPTNCGTSSPPPPPPTHHSTSYFPPPPKHFTDSIAFK